MIKESNGGKKITINKELKGKTIVNAEVNGYNVCLIFDDGTIFVYEASDGGYSTYELKESNNNNE